VKSHFIFKEDGKSFANQSIKKEEQPPLLPPEAMGLWSTAPAMASRTQG